MIAFSAMTDCAPEEAGEASERADDAMSVATEMADCAPMEGVPDTALTGDASSSRKQDGRPEGWEQAAGVYHVSAKSADAVRAALDELVAERGLSVDYDPQSHVYTIALENVSEAALAELEALTAGLSRHAEEPSDAAIVFYFLPD